MKDFYRTGAGRKFFDSDLPKLITALEKVSLQLEKSNVLEEKKFRLDEKIKKLQIKDLNEKAK